MTLARLVVLAALLAGAAHAQVPPKSHLTRPVIPTPETEATATTAEVPVVVVAPPSGPNIEMEAHRARERVALPDGLDGPIALDRAGGAVFFTRDGILGRVAPDGNLAWTLLLGSASGAPALGPDDQIFAAASDGVLSAVSSTGQIDWSVSVGGRPVRGVTVSGGTVAVLLEKRRLVLWTSRGKLAAQVELPAAPTGQAVFVDPARVLVPLASGEVVAVDSGRIAWRARVSSRAISSVTVGTGGVSFITAADGVVARVTADGRVAWKGRLAGARPPAVAPDGTVFVAGSRALAAFTARGAPRWKRPLKGPAASGPLLVDNRLIVPVTQGRSRGALWVFDAKGKPVRSIPLRAAPTTGLALGGGTLWIGLADLTLRRIPIAEVIR